LLQFFTLRDHFLTVGVTWLDYFDELLVPAASAPLTPDVSHLALNPAFELDGTHMNPSYLRLLEAAMDKAAGAR
jgi:hypothetical protein